MKRINELDLAKFPLLERNHFSNIFNNKKYRGWYKCVLYESTKTVREGVRFLNRHVFARFRLPEALPVYDKVRKFSHEERLVGIHRMMIGKDIKDDLDKMCKCESMNEYLDSLTEEETKDILKRSEKIVTLDCNKVPFIQIKHTVPLWADVKRLTDVYDEEIKRFNEYEESIHKRIKGFFSN